MEEIRYDAAQQAAAIKAEKEAERARKAAERGAKAEQWRLAAQLRNIQAEEKRRAREEQRAAKCAERKCKKEECEAQHVPKAVQNELERASRTHGGTDPVSLNSNHYPKFEPQKVSHADFNAYLAELFKSDPEDNDSSGKNEPDDDDKGGNAEGGNHEDGNNESGGDDKSRDDDKHGDAGKSSNDKGEDDKGEDKGEDDNQEVTGDGDGVAEKAEGRFIRVCFWGPEDGTKGKAIVVRVVEGNVILRHMPSVFEYFGLMLTSPIEVWSSPSGSWITDYRVTLDIPVFCDTVLLIKSHGLQRCPGIEIEQLALHLPPVLLRITKEILDAGTEQKVYEGRAVQTNRSGAIIVANTAEASSSAKKWRIHANRRIDYDSPIDISSDDEELHCPKKKIKLVTSRRTTLMEALLLRVKLRRMGGP
ncbi:hypothetical protein WOLCODRAFT_158757 [Wolfiporia cocos MD-104 SS10]|uniref:Uncharacterized protein n=1 Tax=Wolfiporia cocos (strain MD-104) TaxID=742152 RepID=A0A2H3JAC3_WOLCO|nr:hypothetical protein WOLCODRAFT_158757 [Wolfiporia cocos MD-104 SS10]